MPQNRANRIGWRVISFWAGKWLRREILGCFLDLDAVGESLMSAGSSRLRRGLRFHRR